MRERPCSVPVGAAGPSSPLASLPPSCVRWGCPPRLEAIGLCFLWGPGGQVRAPSRGRPGRGSRGSVALRTWPGVTQGSVCVWLGGGVRWLWVQVGSGRAVGGEGRVRAWGLGRRPHPPVLLSASQSPIHPPALWLLCPPACAVPGGPLLFQNVPGCLPTPPGQALGPGEPVPGWGQEVLSGGHSGLCVGDAREDGLWLTCRYSLVCACFSQKCVPPHTYTHFS